MSTLTQVQEVLFDLCDLINSGQVDDFKLSGFLEFDTLREFLEGQRLKLESIEAGLEEVSDDSRSYGPQGESK